MRADTHRTVRRAAFWGGVAVVAVTANFLAESFVGGLANRGHCPPGLAKFVSFAHRGVS